MGQNHDPFSDTFGVTRGPSPQDGLLATNPTERARMKKMELLDPSPVGLERVCQLLTTHKELVLDRPLLHELLAWTSESYAKLAWSDLDRLLTGFLETPLEISKENRAYVLDETRSDSLYRARSQAETCLLSSNLLSAFSEAGRQSIIEAYVTHAGCQMYNDLKGNRDGLIGAFYSYQKTHPISSQKLINATNLLSMKDCQLAVKAALQVVLDFEMDTVLEAQSAWPQIDNALVSSMLSSADTERKKRLAEGYKKSREARQAFDQEVTRITETLAQPVLDPIVKP